MSEKARHRLFNFNDTFEGDKVPRWTKTVYPLTGIGRDAAYTLVNLFFMTYIQYAADLGDHYSLKMGVIAVIMFFCLLWDGLDDPMIGSLIENTHWKWGKYKPWIFIGALTNSVCLALMFTLRPTGWWFVGLFGIFYLVWEITFTFNDIGYWSMLPSLSSDEKERTDLTTLVSVAASIGAFAAGGLIPQLVAGNAVFMYNMCAIVIAGIFFLSQMILVFTCKEHARNQVAEAKQEHAGIGEVWKVLKKDNQVMWMALIILVYYLASALLNAFGMNYFYFSFDYSSGGTFMFEFTVVYALGTIISQALFPLLTKIFKTRNRMMIASFITTCIGYGLFFFVGKVGTLTIFPVNIYVLSAIGLLIFIGQGVFYLCLLMMMANTIEYHEWKTGNRKEAVINSLRPLVAKFSSAVQQGIVYVFLFASGIYAVSKQISDLEVSDLTGEERTEAANNLIAAYQSSAAGGYGMTILKVGMCVLPLILFALAYIAYRKFYTIDEKKYALMREEIKAGRVGANNPHFDANGKEITAK